MRGRFFHCSLLGFSSDMFDEHRSYAQCWAYFRAGDALLLDDSDDDMFHALLLSADTKLWKWASSEP
jgi:hypothetical protein